MKTFRIEFWNYQRNGMLDFEEFEAKSLEDALTQWKKEWMKHPSPSTNKYSELINVFEVTSKKLVIPRQILKDKKITRVNR